MPQIFQRYYPLRAFLFVLGESVVIIATILTCYRYLAPVDFILNTGMCISQALVVMVVYQICLYLFDMYEANQEFNMTNTVTRLAQVAGSSCILLAILYYLFPLVLIHKRVFWVSFFITFVALILYRFLYHFFLQKQFFAQRIVVIGTGVLTCDIMREVEAHYKSVHQIVAFVGKEEPLYNPFHRPVVSSLGELGTVIDPKSIDCIVVALDDRRGKTPVKELLEYKLHGVNVRAGAAFYEEMARKILVERIDPSFLIFSHGFMLTRFQAMSKRILDVLLSTVLIIITSPIMLISALIIRLESPGPVFYIQERLGLRTRPFRLVKFRSMCQDAEKEGAVWAKENDTRVTRFGGFMRKMRIDELPQLWNVLKGEMSLVGPRPEREIFVNELVKEIPFYNVRHGVKPGVTGWAQVMYPYGASVEDSLRKLEYDLYYIKNISIALDLLVIFYTIRTVLGGKGR